MTASRPRLLAALGVALALAACAAARPPQAPSLAARYLAEPGGAVVEIVAVDRLPLTEAILLGPDGGATAAAIVEREVLRPGAAYGRPGVGVGVSGGDRSGVDGPSIVFDLPLFRRGPPRDAGPVRSVARIAAPESYRRTWTASAIRLRFGIPPGETRAIEIAAPRPDGG